QCYLRFSAPSRVGSSASNTVLLAAGGSANDLETREGLGTANAVSRSAAVTASTAAAPPRTASQNRSAASRTPRRAPGRADAPRQAARPEPEPSGWRKP